MANASHRGSSAFLPIRQHPSETVLHSRYAARLDRPCAAAFVERLEALNHCPGAGNTALAELAFCLRQPASKERLENFGHEQTGACF